MMTICMLMESQGSEGKGVVYSPLEFICMLMESQGSEGSLYDTETKKTFVCLWNRKVPKGKDMLL